MFLFVGVCVVTPTNRRFNVTVVTPAGGGGLDPSSAGPPPISSSPALPRARPNKLPFASIPEDHALHFQQPLPEDRCSRSATPEPSWDFDGPGGSCGDDVSILKYPFYY